ncbi:UNVERIFIED_CONTAM: hypothetical protein GTU68_004337, partial [Idotea baltica]|nr:hypothetical protein [Idotea baltica]
VNILLIDHYDSFSYNLLHLLKQQGAIVTVKKCDDLFLKDFEKDLFDGLVFSPGPGTVLNDKDIGFSNDVLLRFIGAIPIWGVCLGHQLLGVSQGAKIKRSVPAHGKKEEISIIDTSGVFKGFRSNILAMRYHSLALCKKDLPQNITITAETKDGIIMGISNQKECWFGTQFHPESIGTPDGARMAKNFLEITEKSLPCS